jgi:hypothetical protein
MPVREMTDEEAERYFGSGLVILGQKPPQSSSGKSRPQESGQAIGLQNLPTDPANVLMGEQEKPETEEDGIRAEAIRRLRVRQLSKRQQS